MALAALALGALLALLLALHPAAAGWPLRRSPDPEPAKKRPACLLVQRPRLYTVGTVRARPPACHQGPSVLLILKCSSHTCELLETHTLPLLPFPRFPLTFFRSSWCQGCATTISLPPSLAMAHARSWPMPLGARLGVGSVRGVLEGCDVGVALGPPARWVRGALQGATILAAASSLWVVPSALGTGWARPREQERLCS